ncbi:prostaglandin E synthase 2-like [Uloborus diversus]|uniref:prostaglandin E synthase 2-like n=1 Tax=Uloborus diversus TaxID=327109 RepID=UPI002409F65C|nr:prostaglandin E synthase 2-like [Uloborus diversus]
MTSSLRTIIRCHPFSHFKTVAIQRTQLRFASTASGGRSFLSKAAIFVGTLGVGGGLYGYLSSSNKKHPETVSFTEKKDYSFNPNAPDIKPSREVPGPAVDLGLELTLYQYQTCPFCCKVRAFLDFYGIPYKVVEVNPVMRQQLKFSKYKKVPILIAQEKGSSVKHQLNDSTVIISILGTFLFDINSGLEKVLQYYAPFAYKNEDGKEVEEVMNKYFLMYGDKLPKGRSDEFVKTERKWREWADKELVHILSPNIYRTFDESLQSFNYFSDVGEWEKNFSSLERLFVIYVGAAAMYFIGKRLKKRHALKDDVRQSLYDGCKLWMKEIGPKRRFHGGNTPNLADLAVYGLLNSIEGCQAFKDLLLNTNIGKWYYGVQEIVKNHEGYKLIC